MSGIVGRSGPYYLSLCIFEHKFIKIIDDYVAGDPWLLLLLISRVKYLDTAFYLFNIVDASGKYRIKHTIRECLTLYHHTRDHRMIESE